MIRYIQSFTVRSTFQFPLDMLRYDRCWPASEEESHRLGDALVIGCPQWEVRLSRYIENKKDLPTLARWESFGAGVVLESISLYRR